MSAGATAGATAAAAAEAQRQCQEEEEMTPYSPQDLADNWEFKIIRSATGGFKDPQELQRILEQENRAGWMLVEKFDDSRVRLKRRPADAQNDVALGFDPYRTYVGVTPGKFAMFIIIAVFGCIALIGALIAAITAAAS